VNGDCTHDQHTFNRTFFLDAMLLNPCDKDCPESVLVGSVTGNVTRVNIET